MSVRCLAHCPTHRTSVSNVQLCGSSRIIETTYVDFANSVVAIQEKLYKNNRRGRHIIVCS